MDLRLLTVGKVRDDDPGYVPRPGDQAVLAAAGEIGETIVIKAPDQMGKSSLLARYLHACQNAGKQVALVDFAMFGEEELSSYPVLLSTLAWALNDALDINDGETPDIKTHPMMVAYVRKKVLGQTAGPLTIAFDEVDRVMGQSYQGDFFTLLRSFHNSRSRTRWTDVDLALVISTEPYLLIEDTKRSPFNVVHPTVLQSFSKQECGELNTRYDNHLSPAELDDLYDLLQGHPYLTRLAYYHLKGENRYTLDNLIEQAHDERGPFGEHLRAKLADLQEDPHLLDGMRQVLDPEMSPDRDMAHRLHGAGLIMFKTNERAVPANLLYARYFRKVLNV